MDTPLSPAPVPPTAPLTPLGARTPHAHPALIGVIAALSLVIIAVVAWAFWPRAAVAPQPTPTPSSADISGWPRFTDTETGITFQYPADMTVIKDVSAENPVYMASGSIGSFSVEILGQRLDPNAIFAIGGRLTPDRITTHTVNGVEWYEYLDGDVGVGWRAYVAAYNDRTLRVTFLIESQGYDIAPDTVVAPATYPLGSDTATQLRILASFAPECVKDGNMKGFAPCCSGFIEQTSGPYEETRCVATSPESASEMTPLPSGVSACSVIGICRTDTDCEYVWFAGGCYNPAFISACRAEQDAAGIRLGEAPPRKGVTCACRQGACVTFN